MRVQYGWRARIGLINIASSAVMEPEFYAMIPEGVAVLTARVTLGKVTPEELASLSEKGGQVEGVTRALATARPHVITFGCTAGSFVKGPGYDQGIVRMMEEVSGGIRCTTTTTAVVEAAKALGLRRLAVGTPYIDEVNERATRFLEAVGFQIVSMKGLGIVDDFTIGEQTSATVYNLAREVDVPEADGVFLSCTNLRGAEVIQALELDLGKPVITAIQATVWHSLRLVGVREPVRGFGRLMEI
ncbi:MAG: Asp/Glu racemase [Bacillota bacterium]